MPRVIRFAVVAVCNRHKSVLWVGAAEAPAGAVFQEAKGKCVEAVEVSLQEQWFKEAKGKCVGARVEIESITELLKQKCSGVAADGLPCSYGRRRRCIVGNEFGPVVVEIEESRRTLRHVAEIRTSGAEASRSCRRSFTV